MPNLQEIKARRGLINGASWKAVEGNSNDIRSSVFAGNDLLATLSSWKRHEYADFIANAPTDIDWLIAEVKALKAEKAQAEAERDVLLHELLKETHSRLCEDPERPCPFDEETDGEYCSNECANAEPETCWLNYAQQQAEKQGEQE